MNQQDEIRAVDDFAQLLGKYITFLEGNSMSSWAAKAIFSAPVITGSIYAWINTGWGASAVLGGSVVAITIWVWSCFRKWVSRRAEWYRTHRKSAEVNALVAKYSSAVYQVNQGNPDFSDETFRRELKNLAELFHDPSS